MTTQLTTFDLGTFEGFNFRNQSAIFEPLTVNDVLTWDHDTQGEAEFWPAGDCPEISLIFNRQSAVSGGELLEVVRLLQELGDDSKESFLLFYWGLSLGNKLEELSGEQLRDYGVQIFFGESFISLRRDAAYELLELYYSEEFRLVNESRCDGIIFDVDRFLDSPCFAIEEVQLGEEKILLVAPQ